MFDLINFAEQSATDYGLAGSAVDFPVGERPVQMVGKDDAHMPLPDYKATLGYRNGKVVPFGVVGKGFKLTPHAAFFDVFERGLSNAIRPDLREGVQVRTQLSNHGGWARREYVFPEIGERLRSTEFESRFAFRAFAWNALDGSSSAGFAAGWIDFFCTNGLVIGQDIDLFRRRHTSGFTPEFFVAPLHQRIKRVQDDIRQVETMMHTSLSAEQAEAVLTAHFSGRRAKKLAERVEEEASRRGWNVFALHSALTFYASHNSDQFAVRNTGNDNVARTLMNREMEIRRVIAADDFRQLLAA